MRLEVISGRIFAHSKQRSSFESVFHEENFHLWLETYAVKGGKAIYFLLQQFWSQIDLLSRNATRIEFCCNITAEEEAEQLVG